MHTRITRRLIRRLGTDSHSRLVWPAGPPADTEGPSAAAAGRASTGPGCDRLSLGGGTPLGGVEASNSSAISARTTESEGGKLLTRAPPTIAALAAPTADEDDDDNDFYENSGDEGVRHSGIHDAYVFELPEAIGDDFSSRPVSLMPTQQALRDAAVLGRKLATVARAFLVRISRAGEVAARLELRWGAITSLDLSHAFIPGLVNFFC